MIESLGSDVVDPGSARAAIGVIEGAVVPSHTLEPGQKGASMVRDQSSGPDDEPGSELRKEPRKKADRAGWIALRKGAQLQGCFVWDESDRGAKLTIDNPSDLPDTFYLYFSTHFESRRHCRVAWRSGNQVGVEFLPAPTR